MDHETGIILEIVSLHNKFDEIFFRYWIDNLI